MNFLKKIFGNKEETPIKSYADFWHWFQQQEQSFFKIVKGHNDIDKKFFSKLSPKLVQLNDGFYFVAGMFDDNTAELIISAEGYVKTFVFAEELVTAAPVIKGWQFTALKPATDLDSMQIKMDGLEFDDNKISFFSNEHAEYPDEIDITLVHQDYTEENKDIISSGTLIYLDNAMGELNTATLIDAVQITGPDDTGKALIPIKKLKDFLLWREKEFVEKYEGVRHDTENDNFSLLEANDENDFPVIAAINEDLLNWDAKASHPWMMVVEIEYDGSQNNGLPDDTIYELMNEFDDEVMKLLPDTEGYLNLGRETCSGTRKMYYACKEFRHSSKIIATLIKNYQDKLNVSYDIFKDKYWVTLNHLKHV